LEEVAVHADQKLLVGIDNNILLLVGEPQGIIYQRLSPHPIHLLNITITILIECINLFIIKSFYVFLIMDHPIQGQKWTFYCSHQGTLTKGEGSELLNTSLSYLVL